MFYFLQSPKIKKVKAAHWGLLNVFGDDYRKTATNRTVTPVTPGVNSIDKVPIQYIAAQNDTVCLASDARDLNTTIPSSQKYTEIPDASHEYFAFYANTPEFM